MLRSFAVDGIEDGRTESRLRDGDKIAQRFSAG